jgi:hypothetical protein
MTLYHGIFHEEKVGKHGAGWQAAHCGLLGRVALTLAAVPSWAGGFLKMHWTEVQLFFACDVPLLLLLSACLVRAMYRFYFRLLTKF